MKLSIFCQVIDHFGDAGIAWRLAKLLLKAKPDWQIYLYINDLQLIQQIAGEEYPYHFDQNFDLNLNHSSLKNIQIIHLEFNFDTSNQITNATNPLKLNLNYDGADAIINLLAAPIPPSYLQGMPQNTPWLQFDYLGLEPWCDEYHGLSACVAPFWQQRQLFIPGIGPKTGGLLCDIFNNSEEHPSNHRFNTSSEFLTFLVFPYLNFHSLGHLWALLNFLQKYNLDKKNDLTAKVNKVIKLQIPAYLEKTIDEAFAQSPNWQHSIGQNTSLKNNIEWLPTCSQVVFDKHIQNADFLWLRGEDSFSQAQLLGKPLLWQAYIQHENMGLNNEQLLKVDAYLAQLNNMNSIDAINNDFAFNFNFNFNVLTNLYQKINTYANQGKHPFLYQSNFCPKKWQTYSNQYPSLFMQEMDWQSFFQHQKPFSKIFKIWQQHLLKQQSAIDQLLKVLTQ